jgi:hypothetical protein
VLLVYKDLKALQVYRAKLEPLDCRATLVPLAQVVYKDLKELLVQVAYKDLKELLVQVALWALQVYKVLMGPLA